MAYVVAEPCIKCKYTDCVEVCPVNCFYEGDNFLVIHPDECIDCGACEPVCPTKAIFPEIGPARRSGRSTRSSTRTSRPSGRTSPRRRRRCPRPRSSRTRRTSASCSSIEPGRQEVVSPGLAITRPSAPPAAGPLSCLESRAVRPFRRSQGAAASAHVRPAPRGCASSSSWASGPGVPGCAAPPRAARALHLHRGGQRPPRLIRSAGRCDWTKTSIFSMSSSVAWTRSCGFGGSAGPALPALAASSASPAGGEALLRGQALGEDRRQRRWTG